MFPAMGLLLMMYPILCKVRYETLHLLFSKKSIWIQIGISFVLNWIIAPLFMVALAWAFLPDREDLREGLIFVGVARCIAMVLIWNDLAKGDGDYCAVLVAFNSILQIILFAPFAVFYINIVSHAKTHVHVGYSKVATSVAVSLGICFVRKERSSTDYSKEFLSELLYSHVFPFARRLEISDINDLCKS
jgi:arsenite transporter